MAVKLESIDDKVKAAQKTLDSIDFDKFFEKVGWIINKPSCGCPYRREISLCGYWRNWLKTGIIVYASKYQFSRPILFTSKDEETYRGKVKSCVGNLLYRKLNPYITRFIGEAKNRKLGSFSF